MATVRGIAKIGKTEEAEKETNVPIILKQLRNPNLIKQVAMALPMSMKSNAEKYLRQLSTLVQLTPRLINCEPSTVFGALMNAAALGLDLSPSLQQCYIIPRWNVKNACYQAQFQLGYRGMLALAYHSPKIKSIAAKEVCEGEEFACEFGPCGFLRHKPTLRGRRGMPFAYYAYAVLDSGQLIVEVMTYEDMFDFAKENSDTYKNGGFLGPWKEHFDEMAKKTMLKKIWKLLPLATEAKIAESADEGIKSLDVGAGVKTGDDVLEMPSEYIPPNAKESTGEKNTQEETKPQAAEIFVKNNESEDKK